MKESFYTMGLLGVGIVRVALQKQAQFVVTYGNAKSFGQQSSWWAQQINESIKNGKAEFV